MTTTPNLGIGHIAENQASKEVTANDAFDKLDLAITNAKALDVTAGNVTVSDADYRGAFAFNIGAVSTAGRTVTLPQIERIVTVTNDAASTASVSLVRGTASVTLAPGAARVVYTDGTANGLQSLLHGSATGVIDIGFSKLGKPIGSELVLYMPVGRPLRFPASMPGSYAKARVAATASYTITLKKNSTSFATVAWSAAGTSATFTAASNTDFAAGDVLSVECPVAADATIEDIGFLFATMRL